MVLHTKDIKIGYVAEGHYAGGVAGAEFAETAIAVGQELTMMNYPESDNSLGKYEYERELMKSVGVAAGTKTTFTKGIKYGEFTYTQYVQNETWLNMAIEEEIGGDAPKSYVFRVEAAGKLGVMDYFDIFGCQLQNYKLSVDAASGYPIETLTFLYYSIGDGLAALTTLAGPLTTQPKIAKDFSLEIKHATDTALGTVDLTGGHDWSAGSGTVETFTVDGITVTLNANCANIAAVIIEVNGGLTAAGVNTYVVASDDGTGHVLLTGSARFVLAEVDALSTMGIAAGNYGGDVYVDCTKFDINIDNELLDMQPVGRYQRTKPVLISRDFEANLTYLTDSGSIFGDTIDEAISAAISVAIIGWNATNDFTVTNCVVTEESIEKVPGKIGIYEFESKLEAAGVSTYTVA